jgi:hypothetical protein
VALESGDDNEDQPGGPKINPSVYVPDLQMLVHKKTVMTSLVEKKTLSADRRMRYQQVFTAGGSVGAENLDLTRNEWVVGIGSDVAVSFIEESRGRGKPKYTVFIGRIRRIRKKVNNRWIEYVDPIKLSYDRSQGRGDIFVHCYYYQQMGGRGAKFTFTLPDPQKIHVDSIVSPAILIEPDGDGVYTANARTMEIMGKAARGVNEIWG